jgi:hypothetical protein
MQPMTGSDTREPTGRFESRDGTEWYRIDDVDALDPFLMTIVSPTDQWMFVSSSGALTAGRRSSGEALLPYETDDRLHRAGGRRGPVTIIRVGSRIWRPFDPDAPIGSVRRSVAKTVAGDRVMFEEHEPSLGMTFSYTWAPTERFGFVRTCRLEAATATAVEILDGLTDVLPSGVDPWTQQFASTLVDGYRRAEMDMDSGFAVYTIEAQVSDAPEPAESLTATVVWSHGLQDAEFSLSEDAPLAFVSGAPMPGGDLVTGRKAAYFASATLEVGSDEPTSWIVLADTGVDHRRLADLRTAHTAPDLVDAIQESIDAARDELTGIVAAADGIQVTADTSATAHHFANALFNSMRGGLFRDDHGVDLDAITRFVRHRNRTAVERFAPRVADLPDEVAIDAIRDAVVGDADLVRLVDEYLPLTFSRRHGDPSRPWNIFQIPRGTEVGYQGNWRDIFQNWEALGRSFPGYLESFVAKFLNASTVDGFNPYRISHDGVDWEIPGDGAWEHFGYWGDHQIVYLHRLLDALEAVSPGHLASSLDDRVHSYAHVPYRLLPYADMVRNPKRTITFDGTLNQAIEIRVETLGTDARLLLDTSGAVHHVTLCEKLLVPALSKLSNLVAGGGIWMNTQRPEWNDANNALVGHGVSAVTAVHLLDYLETIRSLLSEAVSGDHQISETVARWISGVADALDAADPAGAAGDPGQRRSLLDDLGTVFEDFRTDAYENGPGGPVSVATTEIVRLLDVARRHLDACVDARTRPDRLIDSYGLLRLGTGTADYEPLAVMLEGQVAMLTSPAVSHEQAIEIVDALYDSPLYREDQHTFILYPATPRSPFALKNTVPDDLVGPIASEIIERDAGVLYRDSEGTVRFTAAITSARSLPDALERLENATGHLPDGALAELQELHEAVFRHAAFTGRSGTMYRYEGLGSIYWHMVSKLVIAMQNRVLGASSELGVDHELTRRLADRYDRLRKGLGHHKSVQQQGTFPTDPHSHTPAHTGAQQPGMTGQVKEGVLLRWGELGVTFRDGRVTFDPVVLESSEFLTAGHDWDHGHLDSGQLGFTLCGVPVIYRFGDEAATEVRWSNGDLTTGGAALDDATSAALMARDGRIERIDVDVDRERFLLG